MQIVPNFRVHSVFKQSQYLGDESLRTVLENGGILNPLQIGENCDFIPDRANHAIGFYSWVMLQLHENYRSRMGARVRARKKISYGYLNSGDIM